MRDRGTDYRLCGERQRDNQVGTVDGHCYDVQLEDAICDNLGL